LLGGFSESTNVMREPEREKRKLPNPEWMENPPKSDDEYFERMTRALFQAGLNWKMIENKWPNFEKAFAHFSINKVAKFGDRDIEKLMNDQGIVRNESKIRSTIYNAQQFALLFKEFGSFKDYMASYKKNDAVLQKDLQSRFHHLGESSSRTFLWMSGVDLEPTAEERKWMAQNLKKEQRKKSSSRK
jgi:3-methyladenine DNA glycosylase Tag